MVQFFKSDEKGLKETSGFSENGIIYVSNPNQDETRMLSGLLNFTSDFITDPLDMDERARIDFDDNATEIIIKVPYKDEEDQKITYKTMPLGIVIGENFVLFVSRHRVPFLESMIERSQLDPMKKSRMIFQIFYRNAILFLSYLKEINKISDATEEKLHESTLNKELEILMYLEKSLVYFTTSLRSNEIVMERILRGTIIEIYEDDKELLEDTIVENKQALEMAHIYSDILTGMMDAFASVISNNLNVVMKVLTIVTIIMQIPTILTGFYGMNVGLPFQNDVFAYVYVISWSLIAAIVVIFWFKKKKWI
ncbi:MAG TPA: magnesium transporter CorA family protein [Thermotogota bacterium]|nr:magnesium transporter CorA family protein [Thermotogota bacterium]HPJ89194.1 magnesium transporter CorA family protein [Thermotogota bacterium]HPR95643.1 magnesium transporter CorA family protein [Thermotogota bacterium]